VEATASAELNRLLDEMLDLPPSEREPWVHTLAREHEAFKPRLLVLLSHAVAVETNEFLNTLPRIGIGPDEQAGQGGVSGSAGDEVGPYRLVRELGAGGMGSVWLAERADVLINRPIALKLPHSPWKRAGLAERMAREREILATLTHPNIARLYDAGVSADGRPYLAIEYVDGKPIDEYCKEREASVKDRLRLFLQVASAVAHAHAKLVVHRDLKPSNVLVTADGQAHLLDFGIAKLLEHGAAQETKLTQASGRALTPDYASPEQILGEQITIASDVYSLGVLLYELLTGMRPYRLTRDSRGALEDAILQMEPGVPSEVADRSSRKALRGDLDTIILKALKKKPDQRYKTVHALLEDIERHLDARPLLAQPDRAWYRLHKFLARNRLVVGAVAAVFIAILLGAGVAVVQMSEARHQRDAAIYQQQRAEASAEFMSLLLEEIGADGQPLSLTELLDRGTQMLDAQYGVDEALAARMLYEVSSRYETLGKTDQQMALLERSMASARRLGDLDLQAAAQCAAVSGLLIPDARRARDFMREAEKALAQLVTVSVSTQVICYRARAQIARLAGDVATAILHLQNALKILDASPVQAAPLRTMMLTQLIGDYLATGRNAEALGLSAEVLEINKRSGRGSTMRNIVAMMNHGVTLYRAGELRQAAAVHEQALSIVRRSDSTGRPPPGLQAYAVVQLRLGHYAAALATNELSQKRAREEGDLRFLPHGELIAARALVRLGQFSEAEQHVLAAESVWRENPVANQLALNEVALVRIEALLVRNLYEEADRAAQDLLERLGFPEQQRGHGFGWALLFAARAQWGLGNHADAARLASEAEQVFSAESRDPERSANVGMAQLTHAHALEHSGDVLRARVVAALASTALMNGFGEEHAETLEAGELLERLAASSPPE
jgi:eukaryotic-like serine/threonine-protein kinase